MAIWQKLGLTRRACVKFEERVHSIFLVKIIAGIIFDFYSSGRLGKVIILYQVAERRSKGRRGDGWGNRNRLSPTPIVHSNYKSNMANRINDHELVTLTCPNKTQALTGSSVRMRQLSLSLVSAKISLSPRVTVHCM